MPRGAHRGQEACVTLERRFQRLGADVRPVTDEETHEVVRARLYVSITPVGAADGDGLDYVYCV